MKSEAYLNEIRQAAALKRAVLRKLSVEGKTVCFFLVTDETYRPEDVAYAESVSAKYVPAGFKAQVNVLKSIPDPEGVVQAIAGILKNRFPAAAAFLSPAEIGAVVDRTGGRFYLSVRPEERERFLQGDVLNVLSAELGKRFCGVWCGDYVDTQREKGEMTPAEIPPAEFVAAPRIFPIEQYQAIDGAGCKTAIYIDDLSGEQEGVTVCGTLLFLEERLAKNGKPFFTLTVSDGSGQLRASYFSKKATIEKIRALTKGDKVCLTGDNELFGGSFRFTAHKIDRGSPPRDFVPRKRPCRPAPARYTAVSPEPVRDLVQANLFGGATLPEAFSEHKFVVFDLETTGLNTTPVAGVMDRVIELGAVKIEGGQISEKLSTFVSCPNKLSEEIVRLTGITDEMLENAPDIKDVVADFFKFSEDCVLVAHNASFDLSFMRFYGEREGYLFDHDHIDTVSFAQQVLLLSNYKLNTIADHLGFTFQHHRAFDDAFVTAKIFMELVRRSGRIPLDAKNL